MAVVVHPDLAIETRRAVDDKYACAMEDLSLIAHVGDKRYMDEPAKAVENLRQIDECFHTDIQTELRAIELLLRRQQLEGQWESEVSEGQDKEEWIEEQLQSYDATVSCALPASPSQRVRKGLARVDHQSPAGLRPPRGGTAAVGDTVEVMTDEVVLSGIVKAIRPRNEVVVETEDGEVKAPQAAVRVLEKGHPAKAVVAGQVQKPRRAYSGPVKAVESSELSVLFSQHDPAARPSFLNPDSRKQAIQDRKAAHISKMPPKRPTKAQGEAPNPKQLTARKTAASQSKFMDIHNKESTSVSRRSEVEKNRQIFLDKKPASAKPSTFDVATSNARTAVDPAGLGRVFGK